MFRKAIPFGGALLLAGAAILVTPSVSYAQRGGGGHGGGAHVGGGAHYGGAHYGSGVYTHSGGYYGGYRGGLYSGHSYYGGRGYGLYPYYGSYGYSDPYFYNTLPYGSYGDVTPSYLDTTSALPSIGSSYQSFSPPAITTTPSDTIAHVTVNVPTDAQVWFNNTMTTPTGAVREFSSPALTPGSRYTYDIQARWKENSREVTQAQRIEVAAGVHVSVSFFAAPATGGQASAAK
jgi:uncharacterized protein (TIGR03000 family)